MFAKFPIIESATQLREHVVRCYFSTNCRPVYNIILKYLYFLCKSRFCDTIECCTSRNHAAGERKKYNPHLGTSNIQESTSRQELENVSTHVYYLGDRRMNAKLYLKKYVIKCGREDLDLEDPRFRIKPYQQIVAACTGAFITSIFVTPLDVVKIRLQAQQKAMLSNKCFLYCNGLMDHLCPCPNGKGPVWAKGNGKFNGTVDALMKIGRNEGVLSLWSGLSPTLVLAVPATIAYFVSYEQLRLYFRDTYNARNQMVSRVTMEQPFWIPMLAGAVARVWAATLVSPLELIRTKMQSQRLSYAEIMQALKTVMKYNGISGLWMGLGSTLLRDVPFSAIYWLNYETIKRRFRNVQQTFTFNLAAGAVAGSIAAFLTIPFDVVKTHKQIEMGEKEIYSDKPGRSSGTWAVIRKIYVQNGMKGLFTGLIPRVIKVAPACAIMIATFEHGKRFFQLYNANQILQREDIQLMEHKRESA